MWFMCRCCVIRITGCQRTRSPKAAGGGAVVVVLVSRSALALSLGKPNGCGSRRGMWGGGCAPRYGLPPELHALLPPALRRIPEAISKQMGALVGGSAPRLCRWAAQQALAPPVRGSLMSGDA
ncbi:unnamed protein product [Prorocentrum cordatum]|uniref:Secreted protein n=1 Tax=Prorocentrum cordatum TaxID=2364126 RepID=A0ABN9Q4N8_9DINO|nr:unnamed protein product [Polarella glacialis]